MLGKIPVKILEKTVRYVTRDIHLKCSNHPDCIASGHTHGCYGKIVPLCRDCLEKEAGRPIKDIPFF